MAGARKHTTIRGELVEVIVETCDTGDEDALARFHALMTACT